MCKVKRMVTLLFGQIKINLDLSINISNPGIIVAIQIRKYDHYECERQQWRHVRGVLLVIEIMKHNQGGCSLLLNEALKCDRFCLF